MPDMVSVYLSGSLFNYSVEKQSIEAFKIGCTHNVLLEAKSLLSKIAMI